MNSRKAFNKIKNHETYTNSDLDAIERDLEINDILKNHIAHSPINNKFVFVNDLTNEEYERILKWWHRL